MFASDLWDAVHCLNFYQALENNKSYRNTMKQGYKKYFKNYRNNKKVLKKAKV